ncbi:MAG: oxidoreductase [Acidobacteria bacterium]|nr:oxidoreductase [Acidobacteriota bacterium]
MSTTRRNLIVTAASAAGVATAAKVAGANGLLAPDGYGQSLTYAAQRLATGHAPAREFDRSQISAKPYQNGKPPSQADYQRHVSEDFANWRLSIEGMVDRPLTLTVADIRAMPLSNQITHLACEEGWSYIAEWGGVRLSHLLEQAGTQAAAKYVIYFSVQASRWDSIDISEALQPQTIVAHRMNGAEIPTGFGAPLRMRVPRQLGYKSIKYMNRIVVAADLKSFRKGLGSGAAEAGYQWYAGI